MTQHGPQQADAVAVAGGPAIANAVEEAIGRPGTITELPITPQRLKAILDHRASLHPSNQAVLQLRARSEDYK